MANRLTAKDAAKKTLEIKEEIAKEVRLLEDKNAQLAKEAKRLARLQLTQKHKIIISAIQGNKNIIINDFIVNSIELSDRGFLLYQYDIFEFKNQSNLIKKINADIDESYEAVDYEWLTDMRQEYYDSPSLDDYKILLETKNMSSSLIYPSNKKNHFRLEWAGTFGGVDWTFHEIFNAESLNWLSSNYGQHYFGLIEKKVNKYIKKTLSSICIEFELIGNLWKTNLGGEAVGGYSGVPSPHQTADLMKLLGYEVRVEATSDTFKKIFLTW